MRFFAAALCLVSSQAAAELTCTLTDVMCLNDCEETQVRFAIDPSQFVAPQDASDPPRRQIADVTLNDRRFMAQAIMMDGGITGFHEDAESLGSALMIVQRDNSARLSLQPENRMFVGQCTQH